MLLQARLPHTQAARVQPLDAQQASSGAAAAAAAQVESLKAQSASAQASLKLLRGERDQLQGRLDQAITDREREVAAERRQREVLKAQLETAQEAAQLARQVGTATPVRLQAPVTASFALGVHGGAFALRWFSALFKCGS